MESHYKYRSLPGNSVYSFEVQFALSNEPVRLIVFVYPDSMGDFGYIYHVESEIEFDLYGSSHRYGHKHIEHAIHEAKREIIESLPIDMQESMRSVIYNK